VKRAPDVTIEQLAEFLRRSRQFFEEDIPVILERWQRESGDDASDGTRFLRWLVARGLLTEAQVSELLGDNKSVALPAAPAVRAVIVAPAAKPRPARAEVPTAAPPRVESTPLPAEAAIDVELVEVSTPTMSAPANSLLPRAAESEITVELVAIAPMPAAISASAAMDAHAPVAPIDWTNVWILLFLGALGLLAVEFAAWVLAHLAAWVF